MMVNQVLADRANIDLRRCRPLIACSRCAMGPQCGCSGRLQGLTGC